MALVVDTHAVTDIEPNDAVGQGEVTDDNGGPFTRRGFVYGETSQSDPGNTAPGSTAYDDFVEEDSDANKIHVERGEVNMASGGDTTVTITLATPVPVGKSFAIVSMRSSATEPSRCLATATLMTQVGDNWTQLRIQRSFNTSTAADYQWEVITGPQFTVQTFEITMTSATDVDQAISAVDLSKAFIVASMRSNSTSAIAAYNRVKFTSTTNVKCLSGSSTTSQFCRIYVVEWEGATVQSGEADFPTTGGTVNKTITAVDLSKTFVMYSWSMLNFGSNPGVVALRAAFTSTTNLQFFRQLTSASAQGTADWFVISHPSISVRSGSTTLTAASSASPTFTAVGDTARTFVPTPLQGNASQTTNANTSLHHHYNSRYLEDTDNIVIERGAATNNLTASWFVVEDQVIQFAEETFDLPLAGLASETTYYVRAYAYSGGAYAYGDEVTFDTTSLSGDVQRGSAVPILALM